MSSLPSITEGLALLETLRSLVRELKGKGDALLSRFREKEAAALKTCAGALAKEEAAVQEELESLESEFEAGRRAREAAHQRRKVWVEKAHRSCAKRVLAAIDEQEGRAKYQLQKRSLEASRQREMQLAQASARWEDFQQKISEAAGAFAQIAASADKLFSSAREFRKLLAAGVAAPEPDSGADEFQLLAKLGELRDDSEAKVLRFRRNFILAFFRVLPPWAVIALAAVGTAAAVWFLPGYGFRWLNAPRALPFFAAIVLIVLAAFWLGKRLARPLVKSLVGQLALARRTQGLALEKAAERHRREQAETQQNWESTTREIDEQWQHAQGESEQARASRPKELQDRKTRALAKAEERYGARSDRLEQEHVRATAAVRQASLARTAERTRMRDESRAAAQAEFDEARQALLKEWRERVEPVLAQVRQAQSNSTLRLPGWESPWWQEWKAPAEFEPMARLGELEVDLERLADVHFEGSLGFLRPGSIVLPLILRYPEQGSVVIESSGAGMTQAVGALNAVLFHLLGTSPPGKVNLTIVDPIGLGQSFASFMHLADFDENQINSRIWTQPSQIEERLAHLTEHMEKVIQMYLRNEFATIADYNRQAGSVAEKYHVLVVAGFPVNFSETAARRLVNIAANGARCGVYLLMLWDQRHTAPHDFVAEELRRCLVRLVVSSNGDFVLAGAPQKGTKVRLTEAPPAAFASVFLRQVGRGARGSNRVEVPFTEVAPEPSQIWSRDTRDELVVAIGRSGATKLQEFSLGKGTRQHALVAGKTGSGKSNLFHVLITNLALWCSPAQVEFYLVDFKKGVEFKCYANRRLRHARVVAIESDREFGLSVLQRVDEELHRRGDLFRRAGVQDFAAYRTTAGPDALPRCLLLIDEFQELFTDEDRVSQGAAVLLDRIVRQGRAFGIHVVLGSQTLGGAYTLARATIGQMVVRIALQCNEADAYLIMDESNAAPRLLSRPGEGIYNDMAGALQANSPFQAVWFPDEVRDQFLLTIDAHARKAGLPPMAPLVFEGNAPADVSENLLLKEALQTAPTAAPDLVRAWLGEPNAIKGPTEVAFARQAASHLLVVGQNEQSALALLAISMISVSAQCPAGTVRFVLIESSAPGSPERLFLERLVNLLPHPVVRPKRPELAEALQSVLAEPIERSVERSGGEPRTFVCIAGLHQFKSLRQEDEFAFSAGSTELSAAKLFEQILTEGAPRGTHVMASLDTYNSVGRFLGRKLLSEFQWRVLFQMSPSDSASLIDSPDAAKLGLHRALLFNEREGYIEKFRPYALMDAAALDDLETLLRRRAGETQPD